MKEKDREMYVMLFTETRCEMNIIWFLHTGNERGTMFPRRLMQKFLPNAL